MHATPWVSLAVLSLFLVGCSGGAQTPEQIVEIGTITGTFNGEERTWYLLAGPDGSQSRWEQEEPGVIEVTLQGHPSPASAYEAESFPPGLPFEAGTLVVVFRVNSDQTSGALTDLQVWFMNSGTGLVSNYSSDNGGTATGDLALLDSEGGSVTFEGQLSATMPFGSLRGEPDLDNVVVLQDAVFTGTVVRNEVRETF